MQFFKSITLLMLYCLAFGLAACSSKPTHEPLIGEYGESRVFSEYLSSEYIEAINSAGEPNPKDLDTLMMEGFFVETKKSPYRVVMVVRGKVIQENPVKMRWLGGIDVVDKSPSPTKNVGMGNLLESTDSKKYAANENILLILVGGKVQPAIDRPATISLNLVRRENILIESIRLEVWQGKGNYLSFWDKYFWLSFLFAPILLWVGIRSRRK